VTKTPKSVEPLLGPGRAGSTKLRTALKRHQPKLARIRSPKALACFALCERHSLPLPEVNQRIAGYDVDFYWPHHALVVEVDPPANHHTPAQIDRDRRKDLTLRGKGLAVHRYSREQLDETQRAIAKDITGRLTPNRLRKIEHVIRVDLPPDRE
jgi:hypothetical protein